MGRFTGKYTRKTGLKRTYDYELSVLKTAEGFSWEAKVAHAGQFKGSPSGIFAGDLTEAESTARSMVEEAIEKLDAVRE